jgi:hypothetical protein
MVLGSLVCMNYLLRSVYVMSSFGSITSEEIIQTIEDLGKMEKTIDNPNIYQDICDHFSYSILIFLIFMA